MKAVLFVCALAAGLSVAAQAGQPPLHGTAVYVAAGHRFVELQFAGDKLVCEMGDRSSFFAGLTTGRLVQFSGTFANYAGLYDQVMMMDACDIKPLPQS
jgi:hypothetical protein